MVNYCSSLHFVSIQVSDLNCRTRHLSSSPWDGTQYYPSEHYWTSQRTPCGPVARWGAVRTRYCSMSVFDSCIILHTGGLIDWGSRLTEASVNRSRAWKLPRHWINTPILIKLHVIRLPCALLERSGECAYYTLGEYIYIIIGDKEIDAPKFEHS